VAFAVPGDFEGAAPSTERSRSADTPVPVPSSGASSSF
jgi:hypothetical protein